MQTKMKPILAKTLSPRVTLAYKKDQRKFDDLMVIVLFISGWSVEWTWGKQEGLIYLIITYGRLMLYPIFLGYYFLNRKRLKSPSYGSPSIGIFQVLLLFFISIVLLGSINNSSLDFPALWKDYYYLALLPFWALLGFEIGGDIGRVKILFNKLALGGAILSYISFAMELIGLSDKSLIGPMYWPFRFIVMFSFLYYLTVIITGQKKGKIAFLWLLGSVISIFADFYKFTIVSSVIGFAVGIIYLVLKGSKIRRRVLRASFLIIILSIISLISINNMTGGAFFSSIQNTYIDRWLHGTDISDLSGPKDYNRISGGRYNMWEEVLSRDVAPWFGTGLGQRFGGAKVIHNGYLDLYVGFGLLGVSIFLLAVLIWFVRIIRSRPRNDFLHIQVICTAYIFSILAANMFGSVWIQFYTISLYVMLLGGISYRITSGVKKKEVY